MIRLNVCIHIKMNSQLTGSVWQVQVQVLYCHCWTTLTTEFVWSLPITTGITLQFQWKMNQQWRWVQHSCHASLPWSLSTITSAVPVPSVQRLSAAHPAAGELRSLHWKPVLMTWSWGLPDLMAELIHVKQFRVHLVHTSVFKWTSSQLRVTQFLTCFIFCSSHSLNLHPPAPRQHCQHHIWPAMELQSEVPQPGAGGVWWWWASTQQHCHAVPQCVCVSGEQRSGQGVPGPGLPVSTGPQPGGVSGHPAVRAHSVM